jgi:hypothetical protein
MASAASSSPSSHVAYCHTGHYDGILSSGLTAVTVARHSQQYFEFSSAKYDLQPAGVCVFMTLSSCCIDVMPVLCQWSCPSWLALWSCPWPRCSRSGHVPGLLPCALVMSLASCLALWSCHWSRALRSGHVTGLVPCALVMSLASWLWSCPWPRGSGHVPGLVALVMSLASCFAL